MWNPGETPNNSFPAAPRPAQPAAVAPVNAERFSGSSACQPQSQAVLGKTLIIKGEISGAEPLHIEGRVEGPIELPGNYVQVGPEAVVISPVSARELVIRGNLQGRVTLDDRLDIRSGGSLTGDVIAKRISIADGAYFKGSIDMRGTDAKTNPGQPKQAKLESSAVSLPPTPDTPSSGS